MRLYIGMAVVAGLLSGCSTPGYKQASKTASDLHELRNDLLSTQKQLSRTITALGDLTGASVDDLHKPYVQYRKELNKLVATANDVNDAANDMSKMGDAYFASWEKQSQQLSDESLREQSQLRREDILAQYRQINERMQETSASFKVAEKDMTDVRDFLDHDLTRTGLSAVAPLASKADAELVDVQKKINDIIADLDRLAAQFPK